MLLTCDVDVWLIPLESGGETILSPDEEIRAARFRFEVDRARWIRARSALRGILSQATGIAPGELVFVLGPHGKPALANIGAIEFNLSHSGSWAMVAVTRGVPVGVDIERIRDNVDIAAVLQRVQKTALPHTPAALFQVWTRREAMTKAAGGSLLETPRGDVRVCDLEAPGGYVAAVALVGREPRIRHFSTG